ncbi:histone H1.8 isoform X2 [Sturnira hondurensis]|uniref:histone H1.8 isoform X2 n=1 Tax=Sturnira hondurensis TaxID=192404 RepID=UPI00187A4854|nr:histone H1.8 isoform X2 [Sturnira hondurensis]
MTLRSGQQSIIRSDVCIPWVLHVSVMAPGSVASSDTSTSSASLTSVSSTSEWSGTGKPGPSHSAVRVPHRHPSVLRMVLEALQAGEQRRGTSVMAIKVYILQKYPTVDAIRLKYLLKRALNTGMQRGLLVRPTNSKAKGATGSFKLVPKHTKKIKPRKTPTMSAPRRPAEAKKEAPKKGGQTKDGEARVGKARKVPQQPDKATKAPPGAPRPRGKSKVKGRKNSPDDKAHRKTKAGTQSSEPMVAKVGACVISLVWVSTLQRPKLRSPPHSP